MKRGRSSVIGILMMILRPIWLLPETDQKGHKVIMLSNDS